MLLECSVSKKASAVALTPLSVQEKSHIMGFDWPLNLPLNQYRGQYWAL